MKVELSQSRRETMMNILSIDTSTPTLSIAFQTDNSYEERIIDGNFSHSEDLLAEIESIIKRANSKIQDLDLLVCTRGPGSFTGLRVGMATLKGFSSALGIPLVSVGTLEAAERTIGFCRGKVLTVIDARKKRYYLRLSEDGQLLMDEIDGNVDDVIRHLKDGDRLTVTGPDAKVFASKLKDAMPSIDIIIDDMAHRNLSKAMINLALKQLEEIGPDDIGQGPVYIRRSDAEEALLKRMEEGEAHEV